MTTIYQRLEAASRRVDKGLIAMRQGKITRAEFDALKAEFKAIGDAVIADQLTGLAEARTERDQCDWSEGFRR